MVQETIKIKNFPKYFAWISWALMALWIASCATVKKSGLKTQGDWQPIAPKQAQELLSQAQEAWQKRDERISLESAINKWEQLAVTVERNQRILTSLAHAYYLMGDAHETDKEKKKKFWEKSTVYGEQALAFNAEFIKAAGEKAELEKGLDVVKAEEFAALYWIAASLGKWAKLEGIATQLKYKTRIRLIIETIEKKDPKFFWGAIPRFWGAFYAIAPSFAGGDLNKSAFQFKRSLDLAPTYLGTKVLMAEYYFTKKQDRDSFRKALKEVLAFDEKKQPELAPENRIEKRKAQDLLNREEEYF
jgi:hypothetical protein